VKGQPAAKRALEIAAAGGHSLLLMGPPGAGKSMAGAALCRLLPPMTTDEALESAAIASLGGRFVLGAMGATPHLPPAITRQVRWRWWAVARHRARARSRWRTMVCCSSTSFPSFPRAALEALREPLGDRAHHHLTAARRADFPAQFQLIAAMNPCPCGYLGSSQKSCRCTPDQVARYQAKLSGPLVDRIDLHVEVPAVASADLLQAPAGESSADIRARCTAARKRAVARQGVANQALQGRELDTHLLLDEAAAKFLMWPPPAWAGRRAAPTARSSGAHHCRPGRRPQYPGQPCGRSHAVPAGVAHQLAPKSIVMANEVKQSMPSNRF